MRIITLLIVHCSATREGVRYTMEQCKRDHILVRHFLDIGYHYYIERDGTVRSGRDPSITGAHCKGHNYHSPGICYEGGLDAEGHPADTRTPAQRASMLHLLTLLKRKYPRALIVGHRDLTPCKACPSFDAAAEYAEI